MHPSVAQAQTDTLRDWANTWEREALVGDNPRHNDAALQLRKAAIAVEKVFKKEVVEDLGLQAYREPTVVMEVKDG